MSNTAAPRRTLSYQLMAQSEAASRRHFRTLIQGWSFLALLEAYQRYGFHARAGSEYAGMSPSFYRVRAAAVRNELLRRVNG